MKHEVKICCFLSLMILLFVVFFPYSAKAELFTEQGDSPYAISKETVNVFILPPSLQIIEEEAFEGTGAAVAIAQKGVQEIHNRSFSNMPRLRAVVFPETVVFLGDELFQNNRDVVLYGYAGSEAYQYAQRHHITFIAFPSAASAQREKTSGSAQFRFLKMLCFIVLFCLLLQRRPGRCAYEVNATERKKRVVLFHLDGIFP